MTGRPDRRGYDKLCYEAHLDRLKSIKPNIDNSLPKQANFVKSKRIVEKVCLYYTFIILCLIL